MFYVMNTMRDAGWRGAVIVIGFVVYVGSSLVSAKAYRKANGLFGQT
jgi:hypothetical protein